jgi:hypothetical protein
MTTASRVIVGCHAFAAALLVNQLALGDWPVARHDARRTAASPASSDIVKPAAYWRARLGGAPTQVYAGDVDQDGALDVLYIAGGELLLARPDGIPIWRTGPRGYVSIVGVSDLNKDGQLDVVVASATGVSVIGGAAGAVEWVEPNELGTPDAFRIADLDGDGKDDLWLDTCGCCAIENGSPGVIYSFAAGFSSPAMLGPPPSRSHCGASSNTVGDFAGDGQLEMISMGASSATLFRADGSVLATSGTIPTAASHAQCQTANVDGLPGDDLVCFENQGSTGNERGVFALSYRSNQTPALALLWHTAVSATSGGDAQAPTSLVVDLDNDGKPEVVVSGLANDTYTASVLDAASGAVLVSTPGIAAGDIAGPGGQRLLLVATATSVTATAFTRTPPALTPAWQTAGAVPTRTDWSRAMTSGLANALVTPDLNGDGKPDLVLRTAVEPTSLLGFDVGSGAPAMLGQYALDSGVGLASIGTPQSSVPGAKLFVGRNDGFTALLDGTLTPTNLGHEGTATLPGMFVGGYYTGGGSNDGLTNGLTRAPVSARLSSTDPADALLVVDSRGDLVRIDAGSASNVAPAKPTWRLQDSQGAGIRTAGSGPASIGVFRRRHPLTVPPVWVMASITPTGQELASLTLPKPGAFDVVPASFSGDGSVSFAGFDLAQDFATADVHVMNAAGTELWSHGLTGFSGVSPFAVVDWNGDGAEDLVTAISVVDVYSGKTGAPLATGMDSFGYYFMPIATPLGGTETDLVLEGGYEPVIAVGHDLQTLWSAAGPPQPYPYGALATCPSGLVLAEGSFSTSAQLTMTQAMGTGAGSTTSVILASGALYPDATSAESANAVLGQLTDAAVSADLDGTGQGPTVLVGSTDGYLYAVDACKTTLRWALKFGFPVGSPILADLDASGKDQIFVSVADGYLYALKNQILPAPSFVHDTSPDCGTTDVGEIETKNTLYASWGAVPGATSYEVAVVDQGGDYVTQPNWIDVGLVTSATIANLPLVDGATYFVGVRAVSPEGKSPDTSSPGVVVHFSIPDAGCPSPPSGTGGGGTGGTAAGGGGAWIPLYGRACTCSAAGVAKQTFAPAALFAALSIASYGRRRRTVPRRRLKG